MENLTVCVFIIEECIFSVALIEYLNKHISKNTVTIIYNDNWSIDKKT